MWKMQPAHTFLSFFFLSFALSFFLLTPKVSALPQWLRPAKTNNSNQVNPALCISWSHQYRESVFWFFWFFQFEAARERLMERRPAVRGAERRCELPVTSSVQRCVCDVTARLWKLSNEELGGQLCIHVIHRHAARDTFAYVNTSWTLTCAAKQSLSLDRFPGRHLLLAGRGRDGKKGPENGLRSLLALRVRSRYRFSEIWQHL